MFDKMISHVAGEKAKARKSNRGLDLNGSYVQQLRRTYTDVYGK